MGSETAHEGSVPISLDATSEVPISRVVLVRNGIEHMQLCPLERHVHWECEDLPTEKPTWYYARVERQDGEMAWSSPVWIR